MFIYYATNNLMDIIFYFVVAFIVYILIDSIIVYKKQKPNGLLKYLSISFAIIFVGLIWFVFTMIWILN